RSRRRGEPVVAVDCAALAAGLTESELFGHARGAFTGAARDRGGKLAAAGAGTLLLDEVNSLPPALQGKLLRAVEDRVYEPLGTDRLLPPRARLVAAPNPPFEAGGHARPVPPDPYHRPHRRPSPLPALPH